MSVELVRLTEALIGLVVAVRMVVAGLGVGRSGCCLPVWTCGGCIPK